MVTADQTSPGSADRVAPRRGWRPTAGPGALAAASGLLATALVLFRLGTKSLWFDEGVSVGTVARPFGDALWRIWNWELNQSPYLVVLWPWSRLGDSDVGLRLLSAAFVVATVPVLYALGRRLVGGWPAAVGCLLFAVHPLVVEWGQQVRGYSLAVLTLTTAVLLFVRAVERPSTGRAVAFALVAALAVYAHFYSGLVLAGLFATLLVLRPVPWRLAATAGIVVAAVVAPAVVYAATAEGDPLAWIAEPGNPTLVETLGELTGRGRISLAVAGPFVLGGIVLAARVLRDRWGTLDGWRAAVLPAWLGVPVVLAALVSLTLKPILIPRYLLVVVPAVVLLVGVAVVRLPRRWLQVTALVVLLVVAGRSLVRWYTDDSPEEWRQAAAIVESSAADGAVVLVVPDRAGAVLAHYGIGGGDGAAPPVLAHDRLAEDLPAEVWLVERTTTAAYRVSDGAVLALLEDRYDADADVALEGVRVVRYHLSDTPDRGGR